MSLLKTIIGKRIDFLEFPNGAGIRGWDGIISVHDKLNIGTVQIAFVEYMDEFDDFPVYNKIEFAKAPKNLRNAVNDGVTRVDIFLVLQKVTFYGFIIENQNTQHIIHLQFEKNKEILIDSCQLLSGDLLFDKPRITSSLSRVEVKMAESYEL